MNNQTKANLEGFFKILFLKNLTDQVLACYAVRPAHILCISVYGVLYYTPVGFSLELFAALLIFYVLFVDIFIYVKFYGKLKCEFGVC